MPHLNPIAGLRWFWLRRLWRPGEQRHAIHESRIVIAGQQRRGLRDCVEQWNQPLFVRFRKVVQHVTQNGGGARMSDADSNAAVIRAERSADRAQSVMAGVAATRLHANFARREIKLVMDHDNRLDRDRKSTRLNSSHMSISYA